MLASPSTFGRHRYGRQDLGSSPLVVFWETTQACDLVCLHCRACAQTDPAPGELSTDEALMLIDQLCQFPKPPMLVLTGGDPLKRADIYDIVGNGTLQGLDVSITPSATPLVTFDALRRLRDCGIARVAVSLDGADASTHDAFRGVSGSFDRTLEILISAESLEIPVQVNTTVTPRNFDQIDEIANLLAEQDIVLWSVFFLVPTGRADAMERLSAEQHEWAFERLWRNSQRQPYLIKTTEAPHYRRFVAMQQQPHSQRDQKRFKAYPTLGINDGKGVMFIGHTGLVFPSGFMPIVCGQFPSLPVPQYLRRKPRARLRGDRKPFRSRAGLRVRTGENLSCLKEPYVRVFA